MEKKIDPKKPIGKWNIPKEGVTIGLQPEDKKKQEVKQEVKPIGKWNIPNNSK